MSETELSIILIFTPMYMHVATVYVLCLNITCIVIKSSCEHVYVHGVDEAIVVSLFSSPVPHIRECTCCRKKCSKLA